VDGKKNDSWEKVPLTALGKAAGLSFRMTTTDIGDYGANTPLYFALDALTVSTYTTAHHQPIYSTIDKGRIVLKDGQLYIHRNGQLFTLMGQTIAL
jgi:hypothetical protein